MNEFNNINLLDCTLRDGGHVNNAFFGEKTIKDIILLLNKANTDIIELGFLKNGNFTKNESNFNFIEEVYDYLPKESNSEYSLMIRPDWYDIKKLQPCNKKINFLRFAFYYKDIILTKQYCKIAKELGYQFFLNPVNLPGYSSDNLKSLLDDINEINPFALTIVDTYGSLTFDELNKLYSIIETNIDKNICIDLHLHENLNLSFALAQYFLKIKNPERKVFLDASLNGMGRIPGNLCIECIMDFLNTNYDKKYNISCALETISNHIFKIKEKFTWGYNPAYYWSAKLKLDRSYPEFFLSKKDLTLNEIQNLLFTIDKQSTNKKFNKNLAEEIYFNLKNKEKDCSR